MIRDLPGGYELVIYDDRVELYGPGDSWNPIGTWRMVPRWPWGESLTLEECVNRASAMYSMKRERDRRQLAREERALKDAGL